MNQELLITTTTFCIISLQTRKLLDYETASVAQNITYTSLMKILRQLPLSVGAAIVARYPDGNGRVKNYAQNIFRENIGIIHHQHSLGGVHFKVIPIEFMNDQSIEELKIYIGKKVVIFEITSSENKVHVKLSIGKKVISEESFGLTTDIGCFFLNIVDGMLIEDLYKVFKAKKDLKDHIKQYSIGTLEIKDAQSRASAIFVRFGKKIKSELGLYFDSVDTKFFKENFLITTIDGRINIGQMIEIKRN